MADSVVVRNLKKAYRTTFSVRRNMKLATGHAPPRESVALRDLSFEIREGEVYGVLGPNGAGKTTLMKCLATILLPDEGELEIFGVDAVGNPTAIRHLLGIVLGEYERTFHWRLTGRQNLLFFSEFFGMERNHARKRADEVLNLVGLAELGDRLYLEYSTGQKHRLALARGLLNEPKLLILDEPTAGLDQASSEAIGQITRNIAAAGTTVCYTTHRLLEAGRLCDRILILKDGQRIASAAPEELVRMARDNVALDFHVDSVTPEVLNQVRGLGGVHQVMGNGGLMRVFVDDVETGVGHLPSELKRLGLRVKAVNTHSPTIEDVFHELTNSGRGSK